ncbi:aldehyde dehydrogenase family protein, partial [Burkholderia cenocepacia]|uniref:aldehyde dehydrogenase family protein n=1 Tax=Burkholderia cenocepacia TaxID=95486 RepID=UPI00406CB711
IEWFAHEGPRVYGRIVPPRNLGAHQTADKEPVGPVAASTPWHLPVNQAVRKLYPSLPPGCSIPVKALAGPPPSKAARRRAVVVAGRRVAALWGGVGLRVRQRARRHVAGVEVGEPGGRHGVRVRHRGEEDGRQRVLGGWVQRGGRRRAMAFQRRVRLDPRG